MKNKFLILFALSFFYSFSAVAQQDNVEIFPRHYMELSVGDPMLNTLVGGDWGCAYIPDLYESRENLFLPDVYLPTYASFPTISFTYYYAVKKWLHVGASVYFCGQYVSVNDRVSDKRLGISGTTQLSIMPSVRFQYFDRRNVGFYSGLSLGVLVAFDAGDHLIYGGSNTVQCGFASAFQLTAFGVRFGNKVYGTAEVGFGMKGWFNVGIGTRF